MSGRPRMLSLLKKIKPNVTNTRFSTVANTGREIEMEDIDICNTYNEQSKKVKRVRS